MSDRISELMDELYAEVAKERPDVLGVIAYRQHQSDDKKCAYWGHPQVAHDDPAYLLADQLFGAPEEEITGEQLKQLTSNADTEMLFVALGELNECQGIIGDYAARAFFLLAMLYDKDYAW